MKRFIDHIQKHNIDCVRKKIETLQINIGKRCNQACTHCHVEAGPNRTENMEKSTLEHILKLLQDSNIKNVDITGGAPEMNPNFKFFVKELRALGISIIDRCNLTIFHEPGQENTPEFLAFNRVEIVASLPCYLESNVDKQRGRGVFKKSIKSLKKLNKLGYANKYSNLKLNLVYNPQGITLPPPQKELEDDYRNFLYKEFKIEFNNLFTITNMPINRFAHTLKRQGLMNSYINTLRSNFNPEAADNIMCKSLISIGWDGKIYDCDFNQMLNLSIFQKRKNILEYESLEEITKSIITGTHCFGCTAGTGSSCSGSLTQN